MADSNTIDVNKILNNDKTSRSIESDDLWVDGHLLKWANTVIQISNISMITSVNRTPPSSEWTSMAFGLGIILMFVGAGHHSEIIQMVGMGGILLAILLCAREVFVIWVIAQHKCLHFFLNNGFEYTLEFKDVSYRDEVLKVFESIFRSGTTDSTYYYFDLKNSTISNTRQHNEFTGNTFTGGSSGVLNR